MNNDVLTLFIYDAPQGDTEPNIAAVASIPRRHIASAVYSPSEHTYMITVAGQESHGELGEKWFPETKVNKDNLIDRVPGKFVKETTGKFEGRPTAFIISDDTQIKKIWNFFTPDEECPLFDIRKNLTDKVEQAKQETLLKQEEIKEEMNKIHIFDTTGQPMTADNTGKLVDQMGQPLTDD